MAISVKENTDYWSGYIEYHFNKEHFIPKTMVDFLFCLEPGYTDICGKMRSAGSFVKHNAFGYSQMIASYSVRGVLWWKKAVVTIAIGSVNDYKTAPFAYELENKIDAIKAILECFQE